MLNVTSWYDNRLRPIHIPFNACREGNKQVEDILSEFVVNIEIVIYVQYVHSVCTYRICVYKT
jgi:hypothetical protein